MKAVLHFVAGVLALGGLWAVLGFWFLVVL